MICQAPGCGGKLRVSHTISLERGRTQRAVCERCGRTYTAVTVVQEYRGRGSGAKATASKIRRQMQESDEA